MRKNKILIFLIIIFTSVILNAQNNNDYQINTPDILLTNIPTHIEISFNDNIKNSIDFIYVNNIKTECKTIGSSIVFDYTFNKKEDLNIRVGERNIKEEFKPIPLFLSVIPPLLAIIFALIFKEVIIALFLGLLSGTSIISFYQGGNIFTSIFNGSLRIVDTYVIESINDSSHISIIVFTLMIGGVVQIISKNGGMNGIVRLLSKKAINPQSGQFYTWLLGVAIFFDDYANTLVVGNTMRPITDKLRISREKLSYIVDSTAAPLAATAFVTTWVGAELSYIQNSVVDLGIDKSAYQIFISSLQYAMYPILSLIFILIIIQKNKDFGPMLKAEKKARAQELDYKVVDEETVKTGKWYNAVVPVLVIIFGTIGGLIYTGLQVSAWDSDSSIAINLSNIIGNADTFKALLWSSLFSAITAIALTSIQKIRNLKQCINDLLDGYKSMINAIVILVLAWCIALLTQHMHTADFITNLMLNINLSPHFLPAVSFILAALISFSTGTSWGTMAILYPIILPAAWLITKESGIDTDLSMSIFYNTVSTVLSGAVLGDHCSPISDTTVLSSLASSCNHINHVRTQMPYALLVGIVAVVFGTIPAAYGVHPLILLPICIGVLYTFVHFVGKRPE